MAAFTHFFRWCALVAQGKWKGKLGYPQFKTKKKGLGSFRLTGTIVVSAEAIVLPRLGRLRLKERGYLPTGGDVQILSATVSEQAGHWYVSVQVEQEQAVQWVWMGRRGSDPLRPDLSLRGMRPGAGPGPECRDQFSEAGR